MSSIIITGIVVARRDHGKSLIFLTIQRFEKEKEKEVGDVSVGGDVSILSVTSNKTLSIHDENDETLVQIVLSKRELSLCTFGFGRMATFSNSILPLKPGSKIEVEGIFSRDRENRPSITASRIKLLQCRADPVSVGQILNATKDIIFEKDIAASVLKINITRLEFALTLHAASIDFASTISTPMDTINNKKKLSKKVTSSLQNHIKTESVASQIKTESVVDDADKWCSDEEYDNGIDDDKSITFLSPHVAYKREIIKIARLLAGLQEERPTRNRPRKIESNELETLERGEAILVSHGALLHVDEKEFKDMNDNDYWSSNDEISCAHPRFNIPKKDLLQGKTGSSDFEQRLLYLEEKKAPQVAWLLRKLLEQQCIFKHIVDIGGGRADLSLAIASVLPTARVSIIDRNSASLQAGRERAEKLGLEKRVQFFDIDICNLDEKSQIHSALEDVDLFVGLHACGGLTDKIIELAVRKCSSYIIVPCCFCRADPGGVGYAAFEACKMTGISEDDRILLCSLCEMSSTKITRPISVRAMTILNSSRLMWAERKRQESIKIQPEITIFKSMLSSFSDTYSPRNQVLLSVSQDNNQLEP